MERRPTEFEALLDRLRDGDEEAAWQLVTEYGPHIAAVVRRRLRRQIRVRLDSQDIVQAVWKSFFLDMPRAASVQTPGELIGTLVALTENKLVDAFRRHLYAECRAVTQERRTGVRQDQVAGQDPTPSQFAVAHEQWRKMLSQKSPLHREVLRRRLSGATFESIGIALGINERTARRVVDEVWQEQHHDAT